MATPAMKARTYADALREEMAAVHLDLDRGRSPTRSGLAVQTRIPRARLQEILDGALPTDREHAAITRVLSRMKRFAAENGDVSRPSCRCCARRAPSGCRSTISPPRSST